MRKTFAELSSGKKKKRGPWLRLRRSASTLKTGFAPVTSLDGSGRPPRRRKLALKGAISNLQAIERLGALQATIDEASCFFDVTIGQMSLRRLVWDRAQRPNAAGTRAALFLAKQLIWTGQNELLEEGESAGFGADEYAALSDEERRTLHEIMTKLGAAG